MFLWLNRSPESSQKSVHLPHVSSHKWYAVWFCWQYINRSSARLANHTHPWSPSLRVGNMPNKLSSHKLGFGSTTIKDGFLVGSVGTLVGDGTGASEGDCDCDGLEELSTDGLGDTLEVGVADTSGVGAGVGICVSPGIATGVGSGIGAGVAVGSVISAKISR
mmetsp:Transcript_13840/g.22932  ORF Transcript_13840/g.22932 Transcript_13840/m.22932 type:complete len:163 (+) Transcript_13840:200-688(+)